MSKVRNVFIVVFLAVQLLVPLRSCFTAPTEHSADFSWDMFSSRRDCETCKVFVSVAPDHRRRLPWGFAGTAAELDPLGRGPLLMHPNRPALNFREPPQIARMRYRRRLEVLGETLCPAFREVFREALSDSETDLPEWADRLARRWDRNGRKLRLEAVCRCRYNDGPIREVVDPDHNLCDRGG